MGYILSKLWDAAPLYFIYCFLIFLYTMGYILSKLWDALKNV